MIGLHLLSVTIARMNKLIYMIWDYIEDQHEANLILLKIKARESGQIRDDQTDF